jgi:FtsZ-interacting cell division protein ZipA
VVERGNNRYARLGPRGETLFSVALGEQSNRLSFLLDVPRVDPSSKPFAAMIESVRISARRLPGKIIDDSGKALSDRGIEAISAELEQRYAALAAAGLTAGSPAALRVFN